MPEQKRTIEDDYKICFIFSTKQSFGEKGYKLTDKISTYEDEQTDGFYTRCPFHDEAMIVRKEESGLFADGPRDFPSWVGHKEKIVDRLLSFVPEGENFEDYLAPILNSGYGKPINMSFETYLCTYLEDTTYKKGDRAVFKEVATALIRSSLIRKYPFTHRKDHNYEFKDLLPKIMVIKETHMSYKLILPDVYNTYEGFLSAFKFEEAVFKDENKGMAIVPVRFDGVQFVKSIKNSCPPFTKEKDLEAKYGGDGVPIETKAVQQSFRYQMDLLKYRDRLEITTAMYSSTARYSATPTLFIRLSKKDVYANDPIESQIYERIRQCGDLSRTKWFPLILQLLMASGGSNRLIDYLGYTLKYPANSEYVIRSRNGFSSSDQIDDNTDAGDFNINLDHGPKSTDLVSINDLKKRFKEDIEVLQELENDFERVVEFLDELKFNPEEPMDMKDFFVKASAKLVACDPLTIIGISQREDDKGSKAKTEYLSAIADVAKNFIN